MAQEEQHISDDFNTLAIHAGLQPEQWDSLAMAPPIVTTTCFKQLGVGKPKVYEYSRLGNPTRDALQKNLASLEGARYALAFPSGLASVTCLVATLQQGDHTILGVDAYGGNYKLFTQIFPKFGIDCDTANVTDVDAFRRAIKPNTKMVFVESPTNPTLKLADLKALAAVCQPRGILLAVDNTFATAYFQRPLELGAGVSMYSVTKYINGHSDVIMGALVLNDEELYKRLKFLQNGMGLAASPFDCYQVLRGIKTLGLRMDRHEQSGLRVARYLEAHPKVLRVLHPGLESHPQHQLHLQQTTGHGGMLTVYLKGSGGEGGAQDVVRVLEAFRLISIAGSLGGPESLALVPMTMSHTSYSPELRQSLGITDNMFRLFVGLEKADDLIADLEQALAQI